jgi:hypothetical protein
MPKYLIEREIPGAGNWTQEDIAGITEKSCSILKDMGPKIEWLHSYVTGDKVYCLYNAENEQTIMDHATEGGFPANKITEVKNMLKPTA